MKRLIKTIATFVVLSTGMWGLGLILGRRFENGQGYADADEFRIASFWGGREFTGTSSNLVSGWAVTFLGGIALDLRDTQVGPDGADVTLRATVGGIAVTVPDDWRVLVDKTVKAGEVQVQVADPETLPDDAPTVRIDATAQSGGIVISTGEAG